jgi:WD40 repeat protein
MVPPSSNKPTRGYTDLGSPCVGPDSRLAAISTDQGVALVDVVRGEEARLLPLPGNYPLRFDLDGALWTFGSSGLLRWPVVGDPNTGKHRCGPPQRFFGTTNTRHLGSSADVGVVAIPDSSRGALVFHRDGKRQLRLGPQEDVRFCAVSPDGRWVATGSHTLKDGVAAKVWDARAGAPATDLPVRDSCRVQFSPNGKWLLTTSGGFRLWAVGTWVEGPSIGGNSLNTTGVFSCDGKLLALGDGPGVVRLVVPDTGAEIARLTSPTQARLLPCCFTPDGTHLIASGYETGALQVFDLRAIRTGLVELDLDWDSPPLPARSALPATPLSIQLDLGDAL